MISPINEVTSLTTFNLITKHEPTVVYFYNTTYAPCKSIMNRFENTAKINPHFVFIKVDIDKNPDIAELFNIQLVPAFVVLEHQQPILKGIGPNFLWDVANFVEQRKWGI